MATPNQEIDHIMFNTLQVDAPTWVQDCGEVKGQRVMIVHLEMFAAEHADMEADFSHELDGNYDLEWRFESCGICMDRGMDHMAETMIKTVDLPDDLKGGDDK
jgi:hypothetical protein